MSLISYFDGSSPHSTNSLFEDNRMCRFWLGRGINCNIRAVLMRMSINFESCYPQRAQIRDNYLILEKYKLNIASIKLKVNQTKQKC